MDRRTFLRSVIVGTLAAPLVTRRQTASDADLKLVVRFTDFTATELARLSPEQFRLVVGILREGGWRV